MLNPDIKLNEKILTKTPDLAATRDGYGQGLLELGKKNPNVVVLCADLTESTKSDKFAEVYPKRFFEMGVAEQNMASVAAGLAVSGKIPFISSYATFSPGRNWEQIRTTVIYNETNVKIAGHHAGIMTGPDGATHQATEDIAITRAWPKMIVVVPCDAVEAKKATIAAGNHKGPVYLRFSRDKSGIITTENTPFEIGKANVIFKTDTAQVTIFSTGYILQNAIFAATELEKEGIQAEVINISTIKPLDQPTVLSSIKKTGAVVTVEDHQVDGGLGSAISEFSARNYPVPIEFIGLQNTFAESGEPGELIEKYGMGTNSIKSAVKKVLERKKQHAGRN